jgi:agmatine deiminase
MPNGAIIFPTFGDEKHDKLAEEQFKRIFPDRKVIGFYSRELLLGGGNLHCLTQQQSSICDN